jgi:zinc protease
LTAHVGSAREKAGRTGFAHLFEHLLFLESENLGKGGLDKMTARIGGSGANGSTNARPDELPADRAERRAGKNALGGSRQARVVYQHRYRTCSGKGKTGRQKRKTAVVDNNPYGHTQYVIDKNLYPADHPYNWQVIGSLEDLQNATLEDVKEFFRRWYVPNNVTLVVAGDFDTAQAKKWVEKYFSEIKRGEECQPLPKRAGVVKETVKLYHEDNFARVPELNMAMGDRRAVSSRFLSADGFGAVSRARQKSSVLSGFVEDKKLAPNVSMFNYESELAGQTHLRVRAFSDKDLNEVAAKRERSVCQIRKRRHFGRILNRIKAGQETQFYNSLSSVLGKGRAACRV